MTIGMVGLGRMGAGMAKRLRDAGHDVIGYDRNPNVSDVESLEEMVEQLPSPRIVWMMVPSGEITETAIRDVANLLEPGDILVDGGNSYVKDTVRRATELSERELRFLDVGTSGGVSGLENGFCLMAGGDPEVFAAVEPVLAALAPADGYARVGGPGAGHFTKMVHNGVEYGMLQAYAEGFDLLHAAAEYDFDLHQIAALWNQSSVVRSWLLELAENAFEKDSELEGLKAYVDDSGEGRWTVLEAVERGVNVGVLSQSLFARFSSREDNAFSMRVIAALRNEFGGHAVKST
ncbi:MAG TPA: decarboxylating 6-phosphogluconate dehydrogenase [Dehalococcoidia bacterium]|nr:decarboxylating 6-phosphogluconate dehydrogenase [Dehalococcoidia bacterium]